MDKTPSILMIGLGMLVVSGEAYSQERFKNISFVGAGVTVGESVFSDNGTRLGAEANLFHHSKYGFIDGTLANYALLPWFGISGNLRISEVSDDFNDIPNGIQNRDSNGEIGVTFGTLGARLTYLHDVTNKHNGYEVQLHLGRVFDTPFEKMSLSPYVQINYRDDKLSDHLYSISQSESNASGLLSFNADDTWVYQSGIITLYDFNDNILGISKLEIEHHDTDSPLIQNDLGWKFSIGAAYKF
ncbi:MipA/OmpV family protein [Photobacterium sp. J15]|uniref:MipA/OmpV family protein n=1 Tax=Photobacterium sp. J15 TaxID=265901 RepID=UPI0007E3B3C5|nr:MipA/OmpV family protein [Photobacterium sp. J15]